jgi:hypothetical protein
VRPSHDDAFVVGAGRVGRQQRVEQVGEIRADHGERAVRQLEDVRARPFGDATALAAASARALLSGLAENRRVRVALRRALRVTAVAG